MLDLTQPCPLCSNKTWCGKPCLRSPKKPARLFHPDGKPKTLAERGLGWNSPPVDPLTGKPLARVTQKTVTENPTQTVTENSVTKKRGRPKSVTTLSAAEKMRRMRERRRQLARKIIEGKL